MCILQQTWATFKSGMAMKGAYSGALLCYNEGLGPGGEEGPVSEGACNKGWSPSLTQRQQVHIEVGVNARIQALRT